METKGFENVRVVYIPSIDTLGIVESEDEKEIVVYSTRLSFIDGLVLAIDKIIKDETFSCEEISGCGKLSLINEILRWEFSSCIERHFKKDLKVSEEKQDGLVIHWYVSKIRDIINNNKNNSKSMEIEKIFTPFYLEYVKCLEPVNGNSPSIVFRAANGDFFAVSYREGSIKCVMMRYSVPSCFLNEKTDERDNGRESLKSLGKVLLDKSFDNIDFKLSYGFEDYTDRIRKHEKNRFLLSVLNCLDMNFSHKSMITKEITENWEDLRKFDTIRAEYFDSRRQSDQPFDFPIAVGTEMMEARLSNKIYEHFKNYRMKKKIDVSKITCIHDTEDDIKFIKLDVKKQCYGGKFDLFGIKGNEDDGYTLVIREVDDKDLYLCRYRTLSDVEKEFVYDFVDKIENIESVIEQDNEEDDDVDSYSDYIEYVTDHILSKEEDSVPNDKDEFVDMILNNVDRLKEEINGDSKEFITYETYKPIMDYLSYIGRYLAVLKEKK